MIISYRSGFQRIPRSKAVEGGFYENKSGSKDGKQIIYQGGENNEQICMEEGDRVIGRVFDARM